MSMQSDGGGDDDLLLPPPELWRGILNRLPVKSILRFRSVSKSWYSLISCPDFVSDYSITNPNKNVNRVLLQHFDLTNGSDSFSTYDESFKESYDYEPDDFNFNVQVRKIVGSCNGLICLSNNPDSGINYANFLLWNPAMRKMVELLPDRISPSGGHDFHYFGFGFDPKSKDYKVLCVRNEWDPSDLPNSVNVCEIYDLSNGVWRVIDPLVTSCHGVRDQHFYLNGAAHWLARDDSYFLLSFNMSDEIWGEISLPDSAEFTLDHYWNIGCGILDGLIYLMRPNKERMPEVCSVWIMKEYGVTESWTKLFNIDLQSSPAFTGADPLQFRLWNYSEVLVVHRQEERYDEEAYTVDELELSLYNKESKICRRIFSSTTIFMNLCLYEESLVLM